MLRFVINFVYVIIKTIFLNYFTVLPLLDSFILGITKLTGCYVKWYGQDEIESIAGG